MHDRRPRLFQAYCIGLPKAGTTSIRAVFENYRSAKLKGSTLKQLIADIEEGKRSKEDLHAFLLKRDEEEWLEMDASNGNWMVHKTLQELFPSAKFILPIRDCFSWCDSTINVLIGRDIGNDFMGSDELFLKYLGCEHELFIDAETVTRHKDTIIPRLLVLWSKQERTLLDAPPSRTLIVRTNEISSSLQEMADFIGVPRETLMFERSHKRRTARKFNVLEQLDLEFLEEQFAGYASSYVMREYFPSLTLRTFLDATEPTPQTSQYPVGYWINQAEAAVTRGQPELVETILAEITTPLLEPDERLRIEGVRSKIRYLREFSETNLRKAASPQCVLDGGTGQHPTMGSEPVTLPSPSPLRGQAEMDEALSLVCALAERGAVERLGYRLQENAIHAKGESCCLLLVFTSRRRRLVLEIGLRDETGSHWLAGKRFAISFRGSAPPTSPSDVKLARTLLGAVERRVRRSGPRTDGASE